MNDNDRQNLRRALAIITVHKPESWREVLDILEREIGKADVVSLMNLSLIEVLTNLTIADIGSMAEGVSQ
jgi:hypothetical protein